MGVKYTKLLCNLLDENGDWGMDLDWVPISIVLAYLIIEKKGSSLCPISYGSSLDVYSAITRRKRSRHAGEREREGGMHNISMPPLIEEFDSYKQAFYPKCPEENQKG